MGHEWKIGDWAEANGNRYFVYRVVGSSVFGVMESGTPSWDIACKAKHLPDCTGWDWEPSKPVEPTARKWEFGDWAHSPEGIVRFFFEKDGGGLCVSKDGRSHCFQFKYLEYLPDCTGFGWNDPVWNPVIEPPPGYRIIADGVVSDGDMSLQDSGWYYSTAKGKDIAELLDLGAAKAYARKIEPKPIDPPKGYRLMKDEETIRHGDMFWQGGAWNQTGISVSEIPVSVALAKYARYRITAYARKIDTSDYIEPRYRPFANAAEFEPFAEKWICRSEMGVIKPGAWKVIGYSDKGIYSDSSVMLYADAFDMLQFKDGTRFGVLDTKE